MNGVPMTLKTANEILKQFSYFSQKVKLGRFVQIVSLYCAENKAHQK